MPLFGQYKSGEKLKKSLCLGIFCVLSHFSPSCFPGLHTRPVIGSNPIAATKKAGHPNGCPAFLPSQRWLDSNGCGSESGSSGAREPHPARAAARLRIQSSPSIGIIHLNVKTVIDYRLRLSPTGSSLYRRPGCRPVRCLCRSCRLLRRRSLPS